MLTSARNCSATWDFPGQIAESRGIPSPPGAEQIQPQFRSLSGRIMLCLLEHVEQVESTAPVIASA
jgi:hypothetical protein